MPGLLLDQRAAVYRKLSDPNGGLSDTQVFPSLSCSIVPISSMDASVPYGYESTHIIWVPFWAIIRKEDQFRYGRQLPNPEGDIQSWTYVINGRRYFTPGIPQKAYYAKEID